MSSVLEVVYQPLDTVEIISQTTIAVDVNNQTNVAVAINDVSSVSVELGIANVGPRGPAGPQGPSGVSNAIAEHSIVLTSLSANDVLAFDGTNFVNRAQTALTDGGNF